jgi:hypothetical protein
MPYEARRSLLSAEVSPRNPSAKPASSGFSRSSAEIHVDVKAWLAKATRDLRRAEILLAVAPPDFEDALFDCQQAAEKAFKAFLT